MVRASAAVVLFALLALSALFALFASAAHADTIALLPLDADKRLEIYGQPVAAELGRALKAAGLDVVVVGAKATVPETAQLIVDGSIKKATKSDSVTLSLRIRDPRDGTVLETLPSSTTTLMTIDKAAAELSAQIVPAVQAQLATKAAAAAAAAAANKKVQTQPKQETTPATPPDQTKAPLTHAPASSALPEISTTVAALHDSPFNALLTTALREEAPSWAHAHASQAAAGHAIAFEVLAVDVDPGEVPLAIAKVRARVTEGNALVFDRVIVTDTIVGDRKISDRDMAARTAREVLAIANAQLRRIAKGWR